MQIDIPGGTATLKDTLTIRERRAIQHIALSAMSLANQLTGDSVALNPTDAGLLMDTQDQMTDATLIAYLVEWSLGKPPPTLDTIDEMDADVYDAINAAIEKKGGVAGVDTSPNKDKESPISDLPS